MKKKILKLTIVASCVLGLASCLGDSESSQSGTGFAYITEDPNTFQPAALVLSGYVIPIKSSVLNASDLSSGDCAVIEFKIYSDKYSGEYFVTDEFVIKKSYYRADQAYLIQNTPPAVEITDTINVLDDISVSDHAANDIIKDKWHIYSRLQLQEKQDVKFDFYYDDSPERQTGLDNDSVYIDVRLVKDEETPDGKYVSREQSLVADMSRLRAILFAGIDDTTEKKYTVAFRYYVNKKNEQNISEAKEIISKPIASMIKPKKIIE